MPDEDSHLADHARSQAHRAALHAALQILRHAPATRLSGSVAAGLRIEIRGRVQGVGFRPWVHGLAQRAALRGRVWNHAGGVTVEAFGPARALRAFAAALRHPPAPAAQVDELRSRAIPFEPLPDFTVEQSRAGGARATSIAPDWATCDACHAELRDPADRRHRYAFTNCAWCGPRYSIALDVPYDRERTTMAAFAMCPQCRREYGDPADRRFHAEPNACPACGPRLWLEVARADGETAGGGDPVEEAAALLAAGRIVAVKGLGGFHLACDAGDEDALARLRARKQRDEKPFAVMVRDLDEAARVAHLGASERALLASGERPIVLLRRRAARAASPSARSAAARPTRPAAALARGVAPDSPLLGLMLPYTPLHELLLAATGRPLVMTSANLSDEPMVCDDAEARRRLAGIADALLLHDRVIANRCDDSVARVVGRRPLLLRRARGHVPAPLALPRPVARPLLACGGHLKNAYCLAASEQAWLGPHVGDLETEEACRAFEESLARFQRFTGIAPEAVAHDLHPDYFTTGWARAQRIPCLGVQHHHAHVASCMAEHGLAGPVLGLAWDGTGWGPDGSAWGGELLLATAGAYERLATFRPIPLAGGERAIRQVWRSALALLDQAFDGDPPLARLPLFDTVAVAEIETVRRMIARGLNSPAAHGVGRFFDAFGALVLARGAASHEGQVAMRFAELARGGGGVQPLPFECEPDVDLRPAMRAAVEALLAGARPAAIATRFHATLVAAAEAQVRRAAARHGRLPVVLSGGCFQNPRLVDGLRRALRDFRVYAHARVPAGDGGLALGQVAVADALLRR